MDEKGKLEVKEESKSKQNKIVLYIFIIGIIVLAGLLVGYILINNSNGKLYVGVYCNDISCGFNKSDNSYHKISKYICDGKCNDFEMLNYSSDKNFFVIRENDNIFLYNVNNNSKKILDYKKNSEEIQNAFGYYFDDVYFFENKEDLFALGITITYFHDELDSKDYPKICLMYDLANGDFIKKNNGICSSNSILNELDNEYDSLKEDSDYEEIKIVTDTLNNNWKLENFNKQDIKSDKYDYIVYNNIKSSNPFKFADESTLSIENNVGYFITRTGEKLRINISNIDKIFIQDFECNGSDHIFVITTNGDVYLFEIFEPEKELNKIDSFEKIDLKEKIKELMILYTDGLSTCDYAYYIVGITDNDEKYILTKYMEVYDKKYDFKYTTSTYDNGKLKVVYVSKNRNIEINGKVIDYKFKMGLSYDYIWPEEPYKYVYDGNSEYIIVEGDFLYSIKQEKIVNNSKIKNIFAKDNGENFKIVFEDNATFEFSNLG